MLTLFIFGQTHTKMGKKRDQRKLRREEKKADRKSKRDKRRDKTAEFFGKIGQGVEDVVDTVWFGETDKQKDERIKATTEDWENTKDTMFKVCLYGGIGIVVIMAVYYHMR